jgi:hypothetical protein
MKSQISKKLVLRNLALPAVMLLALAGAARAQGAGSDLKARDDAESKAMHQYMDRMETDQKYQETIRGQSAAPTSNDPWGAVRPTTPPPAKPAAKPATGAKTASGTAKPASGAAKPATGAASATSSTTSTPAKSQ